ncbi:hypothetical protein BDQ17DRAFT_1225758, partial [Cyathus striatus]
HYALWSNGIEHGDISLGNLMWDEKEGCGVLNVFDLAFLSGIELDGKAYNCERELTGTISFMVRDLLRE